MEERIMNILPMNDTDEINQYPQVRAVLERVQECEKQLHAAEEVLQQAEVLEQTDDQRDHNRSVRLHRAITKSRATAETLAQALQTARSDMQRAIYDVLKIEGLKIFEKLVADLVVVRNGSNAQAQRFYSRAQRLLGAATDFPPIMFRALTEKSGESQFSVWCDSVRKELKIATKTREDDKEN